MRKAVAVLVALGAALVVAAPSFGLTRVPVSGSWAVTDPGTSVCHPKGGSDHIFVCDTTGFVTEYTGDIVGTSTNTFKATYDCKKGKARGGGTETFEGSVAGLGEGTLTWSTWFESDFNCETGLVSNFRGKGWDVSGTGALKGVDGRILFDDTTYSGTLRGD
jgi:hypothetical protein